MIPHDDYQRKAGGSLPYGVYFSQYPAYRRAAPDMVPAERIINHNGFMQVWAEMGTVGLIVFLAMLACIPLELQKTTRHQRGDPELNQLRIGILVSFGIFVLLMGIIPVLEHEVGWLIIAFAMVLGDIPPPAAVQTPMVSQQLRTA